MPLSLKSSLLHPGERIGVAVSGGADSVALLRLLLEARAELGLVLAVVHFNHQIRGAEADADAAFVRALAEKFALEFIAGSGDALAYAQQKHVSQETAARELRYAFFAQLITDKRLDKIATAHTMDDQAETVLMRLLRGAGTRGLAGIYPEQRDRSIVRPFLGVRRGEIEAYLRSRQQDWREDRTNLDRRHTRNRIRHELLPLLARDYNPAVVEALAHMADVARDEEDYWLAETARLLPFVLLEGKPVRGGGRAASIANDELAINLESFGRQPSAMQRRLLRAIAGKLGIELDVHHVESALGVAGSVTKGCELPGGWRLERSFRELRFVHVGTAAAALRDYDYALHLPGDVAVPEISSVVQARVEPLAADEERDTLLPNSILIAAKDVRVRNWRPGDRFQPAHSGSEHKVKELLEAMRLSAAERKLWPLIAEADRVIWVRGLRPRQVLLQAGTSFTKVTFQCTEQAKD